MVSYMIIKYSSLTNKYITHVEKNYAYIRGVGDVSSILGVTTEHLIRTVKKDIGITPNSYLINVKLEKSKAFLIQNGFSIDDSAQAVGISSGNYFSKLFKKKYGMTPTQFITRNEEVIEIEDMAIYM